MFLKIETGLTILPVVVERLDGDCKELFATFDDTLLNIEVLVEYRVALTDTPVVGIGISVKVSFAGKPLPFDTVAANTLAAIKIRPFKTMKGVK